MKFKNAALILGILGILSQPLFDLLLFGKLQEIVHSSPDLMKGTQVICTTRATMQICLIFLAVIGIIHGVKHFKNNKAPNLLGILLCLVSLLLCLLPFMTFIGDTTQDFRIHC